MMSDANVSVAEPSCSNVVLSQSISTRKLDEVEENSTVNGNSVDNDNTVASAESQSAKPQVVETAGLQERDCIIVDGQPQEDCFIVDRQLQDQSSTGAKSSDTVSPSHCKMCGHDETKYVCPRCSIRSCSLPCVKNHKAATGCTGERNKLAFVEMSEYSERHLLNDYRFLEEAERKLFKNKMGLHNKQRNNFTSPYKMSKKSKLLTKAASKRDVLIRFVSPALSKSKSNTSFYTISTDTIEWHIEWIFASSNTIVKDNRVPETTPLVEAARKFTNPVEYPHLRKALDSYKTESMGACRYLLKLDGMPANVPRYHELNPSLPLGANLIGLCVVEFPTILVLPEDFRFANQYDILDKGDMMDMDRQFARHIILHHPQLNPATEMERDLLNPKSSIYT